MCVKLCLCVSDSPLSGIRCKTKWLKKMKGMNELNSWNWQFAYFCENIKAFYVKHVKWLQNIFTRPLTSSKITTKTTSAMNNQKEFNEIMNKQERESKEANWAKKNQQKISKKKKTNKKYINGLNEASENNLRYTIFVYKI